MYVSLICAPASRFLRLFEVSVVRLRVSGLRGGAPRRRRRGAALRARQQRPHRRHDLHGEPKK